MFPSVSSLKAEDAYYFSQNINVYKEEPQHLQQLCSLASKCDLRSQLKKRTLSSSTFYLLLVLSH